MKLPRRFGHVQPGVVLLASSGPRPQHAFAFAGRPIYCTQFHPELDRAALIQRVRAYPEYIERNFDLTCDQFIDTLRESPEANSLLRRFVKMVFA